MADTTEETETEELIERMQYMTTESSTSQHINPPFGGSAYLGEGWKAVSPWCLQTIVPNGAHPMFVWAREVEGPDKSSPDDSIPF